MATKHKSSRAARVDQQVINFVSFGAIGLMIGVSIVSLSGCQKKAPTSESAPAAEQTSATDTGSKEGEKNLPADQQIPASAENVVTGNSGLGQDQILKEKSGQGPLAVGAVQSAGTVAKTPSAPLSTAALPQEAKEPDPCFTFEFHHKTTAQHTSDEDCSMHNNRIHLTHAATEINRRSICVKADDTPVAFALEGNSIVLSNVAGPQTQIRISYCLGKFQCKQDCNPPKDAFFDTVADSAQAGGNVGNDEVSASMSAELKKALRGGLDGSTFSAWEKQTETRACQPTGESKRNLASHSTSTQVARGNE